MEARIPTLTTLVDIGGSDGADPLIRDAGVRDAGFEATGGETVAQALTDFAQNPPKSAILISDTAADVAANLDALQPIAAAGDLAGIAFTDSGTQVLGVTPFQLVDDAGVLGSIESPFRLSIDASAPNVKIAGVTPGDTVVFSGAASEYAVAPPSPQMAYTVTDTGTGRASVDQLSNIEFLQFADQMVLVTWPWQAQIALLYQGALGRVPDVAGMVGWQNVFTQEPVGYQLSDSLTALAGTPVAGLPDIAYGFTHSPEFQQKYGALTNAQFVTQLYENVLDRSPDPAGLTGWVDELSTGQTREWVLVGIAGSAEALHNAEVGFLGQSGTVHAPWLVTV